MQNWDPTKPAKTTPLYSILFLILFIGTGVMQPVSGQNKTVTGTVIAADNKEPLPGVNVFLKGTTRGTITNLDGQYSIEVPEKGAVLAFSFMGYQAQEVPVGTLAIVDISLQPEKVSLDEIVVVGYGAQRVKDLTAPITTVKGEDLRKQVSANPMQALQGKVAGVQIINNGAPGSGPSVKIRGVGSIGDYANPLYVVDGVFMDNIDYLSTSDIEDLTVLKDASAAAIYGVRAANGVILVTTKKGKSGKPVVSYETYLGLQVPVNIMPLANSAQYNTLLAEANANTVGYVPRNAANDTASTDWYKELVRTALMHNHSIDVSGATESTSYSFGGSYLFQEGIMKASNDFERFNIRARIDQQVNDRLKFGVNTIITRYDKHLAENNAFFQAFVNPPVYPVYDPNNSAAYPVLFGSPQTAGFGNQYGNPYATAYYNDEYEKGNSLLLNLYGEYAIIKEKLIFKTSYNQELNHWIWRDYTPQFNVGGSQGVRSSTLSRTFGEKSNQILDNLLTYTAQEGISRYTILAGQSVRIERTDNMTGSARNVPGIDDQAKYLKNGSTKDRYADDNPDRVNTLSFFSRANYAYDDKYLATLTFRADGSSKYQQTWGYFPSVGLGWIMTRENFLSDKPWLQYLKLRTSWGMLGNNNVPSNYEKISGQFGAVSSGIFGNQIVDGVGQQTVYQNYLKWEVVNEFDIGLDFTTLKNKLDGEIDYYHRVTNNVVFFAPIATGGGVAELLANNGKVLNAGIELRLNWTEKLTDKSTFRIGFNATTIHNEVLALEGREYIPSGIVRGNFTTRTIVGEAIGSFYGYEIRGVYQSEADALRDPIAQTIRDKGFFKYKDQDGDKTITEKDKVFLGSAIPKLITGMDFSYNNGPFDASISLQGQFGNKILNAKRMNRDVFTDGNYDLDFYENRWQKDAKSSTYPSAEAYNYSFTQQANDFFVESGSYIRIQNIQAGYTLQDIKSISRLRVYLSAQRPFTYFGYHGFTPEVGGIPISSGIDNSVYPMQAIYTFGFNVNF
jgi:TonB-linked SusC/RagA family outer membrane protein